MHVRSRGLSGRADGANLVAFGNGLAWRNIHFAEVMKACFEAIPVVDDDRIAAFTFCSSATNFASQWSYDWGARVDGQIDTRVFFFLAAEWVCRVAIRHRYAGAGDGICG